MSKSFFDVDNLFIGCLGYTNHLEDGNFEWNKKESNPYFVYYKGPSNLFKGCHVGYDIFNKEAYYFLGEVTGISDVLEIIGEKYMIGHKSIPLKVILGKDIDRISDSELKRIVCNFNVSDALQKKGDDEYLLCLKNLLGKPMNDKRDIYYLVTKYIELLLEENKKNIDKHFTK